ncbi:ferrous iron transport protein A [Enterococcus sp. BWB1-3]|uniref:ferrous iron transport protein A n=1 Tax=unclassified Enterococcus TaxID=2608891 RepID=UPI001921E502|nr:MULTISPECIES: ferrous iron transport protein A [unclassified Enterococcus]MBL1228931.1 ferrous iron transport protein A [Enterococcus sp. BWB1-3]MCB5954613.1 ferrous iron transport protein A [Enterococcus sp. CWB-B31]
MLTLIEAELNKVYTVKEINTEESSKKHLSDLGLISGGKVALVSYSKGNGIIVLHNSRIALNDSVLRQVVIGEEQEQEETWLSLDQLEVGEKVKVVSIYGKGAVRRRLMDMGLTRNVNVLIRKRAPLGDPIEINLRGYELTLRKNEAELVLVRKEVG